MMDFIWLVVNFFQSIFNELHSAVIRFGSGNNDVTSIGAILFACIVIGFVVNVFWKGARA